MLATGLGKTICAVHLAQRAVARGRRLLFVAHRTELLEQARDKFVEAGLWAAIEQADKRAGFAPVVVASVQTLKAKRLAAFDPRGFDVIVDEAHHATATTYRAILEHFAGARVVGLTATPDRSDGAALGEIFESVAYRYELREAIRDGWLAPIVARRVVVQGLDLSSVRSRAGDLAADDLSRVMLEEGAVHGVVGPLLEQAGTRKTIVFAVDVAHATALAEVINRHQPGAARVGHGELDAATRKQILRDYADGKFQFLVGCQLYTEGFDMPSIECVAMVRPTKSRALFVQCLGRGTRLFPGKANMLLIDFTGNTGKHKLVGPVDALAPGEITDEQRREAERMLTHEQRELDGLLEAADDELKRRRERTKLTALARYFTTDVDPFFGEELGPPITAPWAQEPAGMRERRILEESGFKRLPLGLTRGDAQRVIWAIQERQKHGLCSFPMVRLLRQFRVDARDMDMQRAGRRIAVIRRFEFDAKRVLPALAELAANELLAADAQRRIS